jgi:hypothetical protein
MRRYYVAIPKPKSAEVLDEEDWVDIKRTEITLKHRIASRREKNALYQYALDLKAANKMLTAGGADADKDV